MNWLLKKIKKVYWRT